jgi:hypothetical protein
MFKAAGTIVSAVLLAGALTLGGAGGAQAQSVMKVCGDQWKAAKAAGTTNGMKWREFLAQCRTQQKSEAPAAATPATAPAAAPAAASAPATAPAAAEPAPMKPAKPKAAAMPTAGQFATEAEAKAKCPSDTLVWVNNKSKVYHYSNSPRYGKTKRGAYMCEADATAAGARAAKNEKKP